MPDINTARETVYAFQALIDKTPLTAPHVRVNPEAWTLTEIIGHLVDSASNNHQRFTRLQFGDLHEFPAYEAEPWVSAQPYDTHEFTELAALWTSYNGFLLHLAEQSPRTALNNCWIRPDGKQTLEFLIDDYYAHMQLHIDHYAKRLKEVTES